MWQTLFSTEPDAVMLSGETHAAAVEIMAKISLTVEKSEEYRSRSRSQQSDSFRNTSIAETVTLAAYIMASDIGAVAILIPTMSGNTSLDCSVPTGRSSPSLR